MRGKQENQITMLSALTPGNLVLQDHPPLPRIIFDGSVNRLIIDNSEIVEDSQVRRPGC
jgi:hypothetical protein